MKNQFTRWASRLAGSALALLLVMGAAWAQDQSRLTGSVTDTTGAAIPGARMLLSNVDTGVDAGAESNEADVYIFPYVAPGAYSLNTEATGSRRPTRPASFSKRERQAR